ncbi:MAG: hypothetical protein ACK55I_09340, partial [bacterium]
AWGHAGGHLTHTGQVGANLGITTAQAAALAAAGCVGLKPEGVAAWLGAGDHGPKGAVHGTRGQHEASPDHGARRRQR